MFFLDDDTEMHPKLLQKVVPICLENPEANVGFHLHIFGSTARFPAFQETSQIVHLRKHIGDNRWLPLMKHDADKTFNSAQYHRHTSSFVVLDEVLAHYNTLRPR